MQDHRKLHVWQKADQLVIEVIHALPVGRCRIAPGLRGQTIRAAQSIADLIAEGCGLEDPRELGRYCVMSHASGAELRSQLSRCGRLRIISPADHVRLDDGVDEIRRMLTGLRKSIRRKYG